MEIAIIILGFIVVALLFERYMFAKEMNQRVSECVKAVMSRNINDYIAATTAEKSKPQREVESDEVLLDTADDEVFDKFIKNQNKVV